MRVETNEPCPLPDDALLAEVATAFDSAGHWGWLVDADWNVVYASDEHRLSFGGTTAMAPIVIGEHLFSPAWLQVGSESRFGLNRPELWRGFFSDLGGLVLDDTPGGRDALRALVDPSLCDLVDHLAPDDAAALAFSFVGTGVEGTFEVRGNAVRIHDSDGRRRGTVLYSKPAAGMSILAVMAFERDARHLDRMRRVASAKRRPAAILFGDLEASSALARRLSTASYFAVGRRIVRAADRCVVASGGLPGRHVGDGVVAFFVAETFASESVAARACISAARSLRETMNDVARRSALRSDDVVMRFGLHWGSTLYLGNITTPARTEVTALGDEVNEAARIEACASGGRILASKSLVERLDPADCRVLDVDPEHVTYAQLADLDTATDKARRDAPAIAVCEL